MAGSRLILSSIFKLSSAFAESFGVLIRHFLYTQNVIGQAKERPAIFSSSE